MVDSSELTTSIRILLEDDTEFVWDESVQGECFKLVKASQHGLGACHMTNGQPVAYASCSLTETECNYVQMEKELLAIVFGVDKFQSYLYGR